ncbi:hypothetical protein LTR17_022597 [Elasticomyces elasticus]|nr:hypothetical protein LTR17_022597 [Elasticomyces elasticus]
MAGIGLISFGHSSPDRNAVRNKDTGKSWQTQPVQNAAERPFSGLRALELAIRYKSDNGVMLEVAVPEEQALGIKKTYGDSLKELNAQTGAKSEMGSTVENGHGAKVRSLLVSGSFSEAGKVMRVLQDLESGKEEPKPVEKKRDPAVKALTSDTAPYSDRPRDIVGIHAEVRSSKLMPWQYVIRENGDKNRTCQFAVPEDRFVVLQTLYGPLLKGLMSDKYDGAHVAASEETTQHGKDGGYVKTRLLTTTGPEKIVNSILSIMRNMRNRKRDVVPSPLSLNDKNPIVRTVADHPPSGMKPWELVYRAFTETHRTCEMILPRSVIDGTKVLYGEDLGGLMSGKFDGVEVSVSPVSLFASDRPAEKKIAQMLILSGPHIPMQKALHTIFDMKDEERLHNRVTKHTSTCTVTDLPRTQMKFWQFVLREQHGDNLVYEVLVPGQRLPALMTLVGEKLSGSTSKIVEVLAPDARTRQDEFTDLENRVLRLSGPEDQVRLARATLEDFKISGAGSQKLGDGDVTSPAETLGAWQTAVCSKTNESITYELALLEDRARVLKTLYGADLEGLTTGRRAGVQVLLMSLRKDKGGAELRSVMISGPHVPAEEVRRILLSLKSDIRFNEQLAAAETKAKAAHTSRKPEAAGALQKSAGTQSTPSLSTTGTQESAVYVPISDVPSSSMADWEFAVRERNGANATYELIIPTDRLRGLQRRHGADLVGLTRGRWPDVHFVVSANTIRAVSSSVNMSGPEVALRKLRRMLRDMKSDEHFNRHMEALGFTNDASSKPSLQPWALTRRTRTDNRVEFEFTLPMERLIGVQEIYGPQLENLIGDTYPDVEVSMNTFDGHGDVFAITTVGPLAQVQRVHSTLFSYKSDQVFRRAREKNKDERYDHAEIQSHVSLPSEDVKAGHTVLRARSSDGVTGAVEIVITGNRWDAIDANGGVATLLREFPEITKIEVGKKRFAGTGTQEVVSLLAEGRLRKMAQLRNILMSRNFAATSVSESGDSVARENDTITEETQPPRRLGTSTATVDNEDYFAAASSEPDFPLASDMLKAVDTAWSKYMQVEESSPTSVSVHVPVDAQLNLIGPGGRTHARMLRQSGAKKIEITLEKKHCLVRVKGDTSAIRSVVPLIGEVARFTQVVQPKRDVEKQAYKGDEVGGILRRYYAILQMPGTTLERQAEFMGWLKGPYKDELFRRSIQTFTYPLANDQDKPTQRLRIYGYERSHVDAAVTAYGHAANGKPDIRPEEMNALSVLDRWVEAFQGNQYVPVHSGHADADVSAESDGMLDPAVADGLVVVDEGRGRTSVSDDISKSEENLTGHENGTPAAKAQQYNDNIISNPDEEDLDVGSDSLIHVQKRQRELIEVSYPGYLGSHLIGKEGIIKARIMRVSGIKQMQIELIPGADRGLAYVHGDQVQMMRALVLIKEVLVSAQRRFARDALDGDARRKRVYLELVMPGATEGRRRLLRNSVIGENGDYVWRLASRTGAFLFENHGVASGNIRIRAYESHELEAARKDIEAQLAHVPDLTPDEKSDGVQVVRSWVDPPAGEKPSNPTQATRSLAHVSRRMPGTRADVLGSQPHDARRSTTNGADHHPATRDTIGGQSSQWTIVLILPSRSGEVRERIDSFLLQDNAQSLRRIEAQTACRISKLAGQRAGEYLITGQQPGIESAQALLKLRIEVKAQLMDLDLGAEHEPIAVVRSGKGREREAYAADLAEGVRAVSRASTHPVVIITSRTPAPSGGKETVDEMVRHCRAVTVSSFTTVTLDPVPIVTFNLKIPSRTWDAISQSQRLCVHFMAATQSAVAITSLFTRPYERPEEPFVALADVEARVLLRRSTASPKIKDDNGAILARMDSALLKDKCVHVGDHVVVFAEVQNITLPGEEQNTNRSTALQRLEQKAGLAYGRREYRGMGDVISLPEEPQRLDEADTREDAFRAYFDVNSELPLEKAQRSTVIEEEDDYDFGFGGEDSTSFQDPFNATSPQTFVPPPATSSSNFTPMGGPRQHLRHYSSHRSTQTPGSASATVAHDPSNHSTDQKVLKSTIGDFLAPANPTVSHPSLLSNTIGEFLGETGELKSRGRIQALLNAKRTAERAARELEVALADGSLTEERSLQLEYTISVNERRVARKLAYRAADELRRMLDTGKVDFRRSQWLESAVEEGMVICVGDARKARTLYDEGKIDELKFKEVSERLSQEHGSLNQEAMRLRQMWDEEDEGQQSDDSAEDNKRG